MDPASAIGVASSVIEFVKVSIEVGKRISEYIAASPGDVPKPLENITISLPLIVNSLDRLQDASTLASYDVDTRTILHGVVLGCFRLARELEELTDKISYKAGDKISTKLKKVVQSLHLEERIQEIDRGLQAFVQVLILNQLVSKKDVPVLLDGEATFYEVKVIPIKDAAPRDALVAKVHESFGDTVKGLVKSPVFTTLNGVASSGKSQVALEYCQTSHKLSHYKAIFWLDASTPQTINLGLENIASIVRQTSTGSSQAKLDFVRTFLADSWYPWLLVLDGYSHKPFDSSPLTDTLPSNGPGAILITTTEMESATLFGRVVKVDKYLTPAEEKDFCYDFSQAVRKRDMNFVVDAITRGFDANCYSIDHWGKHESPVINLAAHEGFDEAVQLLLDMGANPDFDKRQGSAMSVAAGNGHYGVVQIFLDHEDNTGYRFEEQVWDYTFGNAIYHGDLNVLKLLLTRRSDKFDPDMPQAGRNFVEAAEKGKIETLRFLLSQRRMPTIERYTMTALTSATKRAQFDVIEFLLHDAQIDPKGTNHNGETVLNTALDKYVARMDDEGHNIPFSEEDRQKLITMLLDGGADINQGDYWSQKTPLHAAVDNHMIFLLPLLLERGADVTIQDKEGLTPFQQAAKGKNEAALLTLFTAKIADSSLRKQFAIDALFLAAKNGYREVGLQALAEADINLRNKETTDTPLLLAIKHGELPMARMLVRRGADQNLADSDGSLPLLLAAEKGMDLLVKDLAKAKDSPGTEITDNKGYTTLMIAVKAGHEKTVGVLLSLGADRDAMNQFGETALDLAEELGHEKIVRLLNP